VVNYELFRNTIRQLVNECESFENAIFDLMLDEYDQSYESSASQNARDFKRSVVRSAGAKLGALAVVALFSLLQ